MKRNLLLAFLAFIAMEIHAQNSIPNGDFESWTQGSYSLPLNYPVSSNPGAFFRQHSAFNVTKSTDPFHGAFAVQISTAISASGDTVFGYFLNTNPDKGNPAQWHGGMPYTQIPKGIRGYYKYNIATADSGSILVILSKAGVNIGTYIYEIGGSKTDYTLFNFTFNPVPANAPDSIIFGALSCKFPINTEQPAPTAEGTLLLDSISLTGVTSQPALFNGDFENWQSQNLYAPDNWNYNGNDQGDGLFRSADAHAGSYALELKTYLGNNNDHAAAQPAQVSLGYYDNSCQCMQGGFPFTSQVDTLDFYYKYAPMNNDSANVSLNFIKNGANIFGAGISLHASSSYTLVEYPFSLGSVPDSVTIQIQSSYYEDTALSFVGSDLYVDDMSFKSQSIHSGISKLPFNKNVTIYPNPTSGKLEIQDMGFDVQKLELYDVQGNRVYLNANLKPAARNEIDVSHISKGVYIIKVYGRTTIHTEKIVIE